MALAGQRDATHAADLLILSRSAVIIKNVVENGAALLRTMGAML
jgi:hypothetical protein